MPKRVGTTAGLIDWDKVIASIEPYVGDHNTVTSVVDRSEAEAETMKVGRIVQAAQNGRWQAAAWWLERKHPERWAQHTKIKAELSGPDGAPITISVEEARKVVLEMLNEGGDDGLIIDGESPEVIQE
jgi:hypothetical protein